MTQASLRRYIGIVPQDTVLFNETIGYNIAYGAFGASDEQVMQAANMAQLSEFILRLPEKLNTVVGERGVLLFYLLLLSLLCLTVGFVLASCGCLAERSSG